MNRTVLLLRNQMNVIELLEIITEVTEIKECSYHVLHSGMACCFCGQHRIAVITNATSLYVDDNTTLTHQILWS